MTLSRWHMVVCALLLSCTNGAAQSRVVDRIVALIDREIIVESELNSQIEFFVFNNKVDPSTPNLKKLVLESMLNEKLILAKAVEDSIVVTDDEVAQQLDALIQQRVQQVGSERRLEEIYGMPVSRIRREFRDDMRKQLLINKLQQTKFSTVPVSRREVEEFFAAYKDSLPVVPEEVELYHIFRLPRPGDATKLSARARALGILDSLKAGGDFADLARRHSEDPGSAALGGDLGFVRRGQLVKEFEEVAFALRQNELSGIVETSFGFHIIQLLERRGESIHPRHILFKIEQDTSAESTTIALLNTLKDSAMAGMPITELAKRHSEDAETAPIGGYLGTLAVNQLDPALSNALTTMKPGDISEPMRVNFGTSWGFHIVYLKDRIPEHAMNLSDDWKRIEQIAGNLKRSKEHQRWIDDLKKDIFWEIRL
jgi:peptidyl-prolyl cis-trans isomerase SurA